MIIRESNGSATNPEKQLALDPDIVESYVDLMCRFRPQDVCNFIKMNEGYRLEETLEVGLKSLEVNPVLSTINQNLKKFFFKL